MGNEKGLNLISERTIQPSFNVFIELKPQISSFVELTLLNDQDKNAENAEVTAVLLAVTEPIETDSNTFLLLYLQDTYLTLLRIRKDAIALY